MTSETSAPVVTRIERCISGDSEAGVEAVWADVTHRGETFGVILEREREGYGDRLSRWGPADATGWIPFGPARDATRRLLLSDADLDAIEAAVRGAASMAGID